jgi:hypothetical protein
MVAMNAISSVGDYAVESDSLFLSFAVGKGSNAAPDKTESGDVSSATGTLQASSSPEALEVATTIFRLITKDLKKIDNERALNLSLLRLATLCITSDKESSRRNQQLVLQARGHRAIVEAMKAYPKNKMIQQNGIRSLSNFSYDASEAKFMVVVAGGIETIVDAMKAHPLCFAIQQLGCHALLILLADSQDNASRVVNTGGIVTFVSAMNLYRDKREILQDGCRLARELIRLSPGAQSELAGYVSTFIAVMENEELESNLREEGRQSMMAILLSG